jgi:hypothetical protein
MAHVNGWIEWRKSKKMAHERKLLGSWGAAKQPQKVRHSGGMRL